VDLGLQLALLPLDNKEKEGSQASIQRKFASHLLGAPLATCVLSKDCLLRLAAPPSLTLLVSLFSTATKNDVIAEAIHVVSPSPHPVFEAGHWALGNLASLFPFMPLAPSLSVGGVSSHDKEGKSSFELVSDSQLIRYIDVLGHLFTTHGVPGVLQGKRGVVWHKQGAVLSASGVPIGLQQQVLAALDATTCRSLYSRVLRPLSLVVTTSVPSTLKKSWGKDQKYDTIPSPNKGDLKDIAAALSSSGVKLAQRDMKERQAESVANSSYFGLGAGSVWAKKLTKSLGSMLFGNGSSSDQQDTNEALRAQVMQHQANQDNGTAGASKAILDNEPASPFPLSIPVVESLCRFWSILLPAAATSATPDSAPWRALSGLCFSTRAVNRLWGYALNASIVAGSDFASISSSNSDFGLERDLNLRLQSQQGKVVSAVAVLVAMLKVQLIALDDSELYELEVFCALL
jgi:hypothetical protein